MKYHRDKIGALFLALADLICISGVIGLALYLRYYSGLLPYLARQPLWETHRPFIIVVYMTVVPALVLVGGYRLPYRWRSNQALPAVAKALLVAIPVSILILYALRFGVERGELVQTPSRLFVVLVWAGLLAGLTGVRRLGGQFQLWLYRRGIGLRRALIVGEAAEAARLIDRIKQNPWLGEQVVGRVGHQTGPDRLGEPAALAELVREHRIDVIWLAPPVAPGADWLPWLLFAVAGQKIIWRVLPEDFEHLDRSALPDLSYEERAIFFNRLQHQLALPALRVAMLGSRGAPANYSGVEKYIEEVGSCLVQWGLEVAVYCHAKYVAERGYYRGMELRFMPTLTTKHLETIIHTILATGHALLAGEDIFHYHALGPTTTAWLPRLLGRKVVVTVQGVDWARVKWGRIARLYLKFGEWATCHFPHRTIVVSQSLVEHYARYHGKQTIYIPNGFDPPVHRQPEQIKTLGLTKDGYILFVGRLSPEKGCHTLVRAFARLQTDKQLVMAGRPTYDNNYHEQLLAEVGDLASIRLVGFVQGPLLQELYAHAYLVVNTSELEGLSVSLLEAISYNNCLLVSNIPENLEATQGLGFSFQVGDEADLARQLQDLLDQPARVEAMRATVQTHLANFMAWEQVAQATLAVYQSLYTPSDRH